MKTWAETIQDCVDNKWAPELRQEVPDIERLLQKCDACNRAHYAAGSEIGSKICDHCPVKALSGGDACAHTPYMALSNFWRDINEDEGNLFDETLEEAKKIVQDEVHFLQNVKQFCIDTSFGEKS